MLTCRCGSVTALKGVCKWSGLGGSQSALPFQPERNRTETDGINIGKEFGHTSIHSLQVLVSYLLFVFFPETVVSQEAQLGLCTRTAHQ